MNFSFISLFITKNMDYLIVNSILLGIHLRDVFLEPSIVGVVNFYGVFASKVSQDNL